MQVLQSKRQAAHAAHAKANIAKSLLYSYVNQLTRTYQPGGDIFGSTSTAGSTGANLWRPESLLVPGPSQDLGLLTPGSECGLGSGPSTRVGSGLGAYARVPLPLGSDQLEDMLVDPDEAHIGAGPVMQGGGGGSVGSGALQKGDRR